ncbi:MAG: diacylglycerol kinase [Microbacteriaceae bacterium]|nr:diacylglycerol kinase [Microbacteriaceae bacterium]
MTAASKEDASAHIAASDEVDTPENEAAAPAGIAVVFNPRKVDVPRVKAAIRAAATAAGLPKPQWIERSKKHRGRKRIRKATRKGVDLVVAVGGDGTVRTVADALRGTGATLAIIPSGTGNLLARNLGLPLSSFDDALTIALGNSDRAIDIGVATLTAIDGKQGEHAFVVMAGLGLDAAIVANTNSALKDRVGWLAYVDAGVRSLPKVGKVRVHYAIGDDAVHSAHVRTIVVANCGSLPGNIQLIPDALIDDGLLDIAVMQPKTIFGWLRIWSTVGWENRVLRRTSLGRSYIQLTNRGRETQLTYLRGDSISIAVDEPQQFELDGDDFGEVISVKLRVDPGGLVVKVAGER